MKSRYSPNVCRRGFGDSILASIPLRGARGGLGASCSISALMRVQHSETHRTYETYGSHDACPTLYVNPPAVNVPLEQKHRERGQHDPLPQLERLPALLSGDELVAADVDGRARRDVALAGVEQIDGKGHAAFVTAGDLVQTEAVGLFEDEVRPSAALEAPPRAVRRRHLHPLHRCLRPQHDR